MLTLISVLLLMFAPQDNILHRAPVDYPRAAKDKGIQGSVVVEVNVDEAGAELPGEGREALGLADIESLVALTNIGLRLFPLAPVSLTARCLPRAASAESRRIL